MKIFQAAKMEAKHGCYFISLKNYKVYQPCAAVSRCCMLCEGKSSQWNEQANKRLFLKLKNYGCRNLTILNSKLSFVKLRLLTLFI